MVEVFEQILHLVHLTPKFGLGLRQSFADGEQSSDSDLTDDFVPSHLNQKVKQLLQRAEALELIDPITAKVLRPLQQYRGLILFKSFGTDGPSLKANDFNKTIFLNLDAVNLIKGCVDKDEVCFALMLFLCHEVSHISQGLKDYKDVQGMKKVDEESARDRMGELDLRSDFWAAHTLSLFYSLHQNFETYDQTKYIRWLHKIWCEICPKMLNAFPNSDRTDKQQRIFGFLLMSILIKRTYIRNNCRTLEFKSELWPCWSKDLEYLSIYSNGEPFIPPGSSVDKQLMLEILQLISSNNYDAAEAAIENLWKQVPKPY